VDAITLLKNDHKNVSRLFREFEKAHEQHAGNRSSLVDQMLAELADLSPDDERYDAKVSVLIEMVRHHVEEEEQELFPTVREALGRKRLGEIGDQLESAKKKAPRTPDPRRLART